MRQGSKPEGCESEGNLFSRELRLQEGLIVAGTVNQRLLRYIVDR